MKFATVPYRSRAGPFAACLVMSLLGLTAAQAASHRVVLPAGSVIPVRLDRSLSSKTAHSGDRFTATVRYGKDDGGLPEGAQVNGVVREAIAAADGKPGVLDMDFRRMVTPGGQDRTLTGSLISLDAKSVKRSESGRLVASTDKSKDRLKFIGIGAGAGLLIGVLTKGNNLMDTLLGAAAGYLYNEFGNNPKPGDVNLKAGTEFGIRLDREFAFQTNQPDTQDAAPSGETDTSYHRRHDRTTDLSKPISEKEAFDGDIRMLIDDRDVPFGSAKPFLYGRQVMVPLDAVSRAANFDSRYDPNTKMIRARHGALRLGLHSRIAVLNGQRHRLNALAEMRNGVVYVPLQFIALAMRGSASWDASSRTVVLTTGRSAEDGEGAAHGGDSMANVDHDGIVDVGGEHILTIRAAGDGKTIAQRANDVTERLIPILSENDLTAADIRTAPARGDRVKIMVMDHLLVTVLPEDARANGTQPLALAQIWVAHLQKILPRINVKSNPNNQRGD